MKGVPNASMPKLFKIPKQRVKKSKAETPKVIRASMSEVISDFRPSKKRKSAFSTSAVLENRAVTASVRKNPVVPCVVCGEQSAPNSNEQLCWVCRRLKISAWRDTDLQPAQGE